jgi:hypothetical protein
MGFVRKRPVATAAYDPALRMQARLWGLFFYLIRPVLAGVVVFVVRHQPLSTGNFTSSGPVTADGRTGSGWPTREAARSRSASFSSNDGAVPLTDQQGPGHRPERATGAAQGGDGGEARRRRHRRGRSGPRTVPSVLARRSPATSGWTRRRTGPARHARQLNTAVPDLRHDAGHQHEVPDQERYLKAHPRRRQHVVVTGEEHRHLADGERGEQERVRNLSPRDACNCTIAPSAT